MLERENSSTDHRAGVVRGLTVVFERSLSLYQSSDLAQNNRILLLVLSGDLEDCDSLGGHLLHEGLVERLQRGEILLREILLHFSTSFVDSLTK